MDKKNLIPTSSYSFFTIILTIMLAMVLGVAIFESKMVSNMRTQLMHPILGISLALAFIIIIFQLTGSYTKLPIIGLSIDTGALIYVCILTLILFILG